METLKKDINKSVYNMCVIKSLGRNAFNGGVIIIFFNNNYFILFISVKVNSLCIFM